MRLATNEGQATREPVLVAVEQTTHVRREILDPGDGLRQQSERTHDEHLGTWDPPHRSVPVELAVERIRILDHLRIEQQRSGDLLVHWMPPS
jgi:hypothetical protein